MSRSSSTTRTVRGMGKTRRDNGSSTTSCAVSRSQDWETILSARARHGKEMLTRTRSNSFVVNGTLTRTVRFAGRSTPAKAITMLLANNQANSALGGNFAEIDLHAGTAVHSTRSVRPR